MNDATFAELAEIVREKGTDRGKFFRGEVDKYTWQHVGSSFLPSELSAAFLWAQLEEAHELTRRRLVVWDRYHAALAPLEAAGVLRRPVIPDGCAHNAHMYYVLVADLAARTRLLAALHERGILAIFHYVPLHSSPAGRRYGRTHGSVAVTDDVADRIVRLPMWIGLTPDVVDEIAATIASVLG